MDDVAYESAKNELHEAMIECQVGALVELSAIVEALLSATEPSESESRRTILVAGSRRSLQTAEIIADLAQKQFVEDMAILSRTLA